MINVAHAAFVHGLAVTMRDDDLGRIAAHEGTFERRGPAWSAERGG